MNNVKKYLLPELTDAEVKRFENYMKSDTGGSQAFQRLVLQLANQEYTSNLMRDIKKLSQEAEELYWKVYKLEYYSSLFYNYIGVDDLAKADYSACVDQFEEQFEDYERPHPEPVLEGLRVIK